MLVMYHLICFTPFVPDVDIRFKLGYLACSFVVLHLLISLFILLKSQITDFRK